MLVYQTDHEGFFVGLTNADPDPLQDAVWLIPAGCVEEEPPVLTQGQRAKRVGQSWVIVEPEPAPEPKPEPTPEEILTAWRTTAKLYRRDFCIALKRMGILPVAEAIAAAKGDWPTSFASALSGLTQDEQDEAEIEWAAVVEIRRNHPMIALLANHAALTDAQVDTLFGWTP